jgi:transcription antitermination factor NusA-like protein
VIIVNGETHEDTEGRIVKKRAAVFVEEAQRPMAIGKKGQNIRLATQLTGFELDMYNYEELPAFKAKLAELKGEEVEVAMLNVPAEAAGAEEAPAKEEAPKEEEKKAE